MKKYTYVLWDFNGTILDDVETCVKCVNKLLSERGLNTIHDVDEYRSIFGFPIIEYYKRAGFDFTRESYEEIAPQWVEQYLIHVKNAHLFPDVKETVERFHESSIKQTVLSATEICMLKSQIADLGLTNCFDEIYGLDNIHAASKVELAKTWREAHKNECVLMLGDTVHDAEVASEINADCFLVARGHQLRSTLEKTGATVIDSLCDIKIE